MRWSQFSYSEGSPKKTEIISDQKSALVINVYIERKSRSLRAKSALVECLLYL